MPHALGPEDESSGRRLDSALSNLKHELAFDYVERLVFDAMCMRLHAAAGIAHVLEQRIGAVGVFGNHPESRTRRLNENQAFRRSSARFFVLHLAESGRRKKKRESCYCGDGFHNSTPLKDC